MIKVSVLPVYNTGQVSISAEKLRAGNGKKIKNLDFQYFQNIKQCIL